MSIEKRQVEYWVVSCPLRTRDCSHPGEFDTEDGAREFARLNPFCQHHESRLAHAIARFLGYDHARQLAVGGWVPVAIEEVVTAFRELKDVHPWPPAWTRA